MAEPVTVILRQVGIQVPGAAALGELMERLRPSLEADGTSCSPLDRMAKAGIPVFENQAGERFLIRGEPENREAVALDQPGPSGGGDGSLFIPLRGDDPADAKPPDDPGLLDGLRESLRDMPRDQGMKWLAAALPGLASGSPVSQVLGDATAGLLGQAGGGRSQAIADQILPGLGDRLAGLLGASGSSPPGTIPGATPPFNPNATAGSTPPAAPGTTPPINPNDPKKEPPGLGDFVPEAMDKLATAVLGQWKIDDADAMEEQVAKLILGKYKDKLIEAVKDWDAFTKKVGELFNGQGSTASVPLGRFTDPNTSEGFVGEGTPTVLVEKLLAARLAHTMTMVKPAPDVGPFLSGNPTILIEDKPAAGQGHVAVGAKTGIVALMQKGATTVLMGPAGMPVAIPTPKEGPVPNAPDAPKDGKGEGKAPSKGGGGGKAPAKDGDKAPEDKKPEEKAPEDPKPEEKQPEEDSEETPPAEDRAPEETPPEEREESPAPRDEPEPTPKEDEEVPLKKYEVWTQTDQGSVGFYSVVTGKMFVIDQETGKVYMYRLAGHGPGTFTKYGVALVQTFKETEIPANVDPTKLGGMSHQASVTGAYGIGATASTSINPHTGKPEVETGMVAGAIVTAGAPSGNLLEVTATYAGEVESPFDEGFVPGLVRDKHLPGRK